MLLEKLVAAGDPRGDQQQNKRTRKNLQKRAHNLLMSFFDFWGVLDFFFFSLGEGHLIFLVIFFFFCNR